MGGLLNSFRWWSKGEEGAFSFPKKVAIQLKDFFSCFLVWAIVELSNGINYIFDSLRMPVITILGIELNGYFKKEVLGFVKC